LGLSGSEEIMTLAFFVSTQYRLVTDRQTDTLRSLLPTLAEYRARNKVADITFEKTQQNALAYLTNLHRMLPLIVWIPFVCNSLINPQKIYPVLRCTHFTSQFINWDSAHYRWSRKLIYYFWFQNLQVN